jgi:DNA invertase Pin-like site-specific DNA recombinase
MDDRPVRDGAQVYAYVRVSTEEQGRSGLGIAAQITAIESYVRGRGWTLGELHEEVASGARHDRPVLASLLSSLRPGDTLVVARLDRLTRSLLHFASVVEVASRSGWSLVVVDQGFDLGTPSGRAMAGMCAVFASYERELIGQRTSAALRALPRERRNGQPAYTDAVRRRAHELHDLGMSLRAIASVLLAEGVVPVRGGATLHASAVSRMLEEDVPAA